MGLTNQPGSCKRHSVSPTDTISTKPKADKRDQRKKRKKRPSMLSYRIEYAGYQVMRFILRALPFRVASTLSSYLWRLLAPRFYRHPRAIKHLRLAYPEKSEAQCEVIALEMWRNLGRTMAEAFVIDRFAARRDVFEFVIPPEIEADLRAKKPLIITMPHLGNWELVAVIVKFFGHEFAAIYQRVLNPFVDRAVVRTRAPFYPAGLFPKGHDSVRNIMRLLRQGKAIGIVSDLREARGLKIPFFNREAKTSPFPAMLSLLYDAPIVAARCVRIAPDRFLIEMKYVTAPNGETRDETIYNRTAAIHAVFEDWIRQYPEQWMWSHRRWD